MAMKNEGITAMCIHIGESQKHEMEEKTQVTECIQNGFIYVTFKTCRSDTQTFRDTYTRSKTIKGRINTKFRITENCGGRGTQGASDVLTIFCFLIL